jgi:hypothetical protein
MSRKSTYATAAAHALLTALAVRGAGFSEDAVDLIRAGNTAGTQNKETRNERTDDVDRTGSRASVRPAHPGRA